jgi:hydroxyethylthiazole kinase-like uncharacterized protein yjeF
MIPIFKEVYSLDKACYDKGLNEYILMENAARGMYEEIKSRKIKSICIISGSGNNGADGIALARMLLGEYDVNLFLPMGVKSQMAKFQFEVYKNYGGKYSEFTPTAADKKYDCYVDAIFGSGLKRDLDNKINNIIKALNKREGFKLSCDIPTGLDEDGNSKGEIFRADITVTMGAIKVALLSDFAKDFVGKIKKVDLGISFKKYTKKTNYYLLQKEDLILPIRTKSNTHKGSFGHIGVLVGEKNGAGIISALAALNFGAGLVTCITREKLHIPYELMQNDIIDDRFNTLVFGMGMGNFFDDEIEKICNLDIKKVIDADMFYKQEILNCLDKEVVLTPHPKEFASLLKLTGFGEYSINDIQKNRFNLSLKFTKKYPKVVLLLKGANTIISYKGQLYINPLGTQALSKGGSGDVLAGMIGSLIAQGYHILKATISASLAHSLAGDVKPNYSLTPIKLINNLERII